MANVTVNTTVSTNSVMRTIQYRAPHEQRRITIRDRRNDEGEPILNGIDYVEVSPNRATLSVYFIHPLTIALTLDNIEITRVDPNSLETDRIADRIEVRSLSIFNQRLTLGVVPPQDLFTYAIALVETRHFGNPQPPDGIDPKLAQVEFVFQVGERSEFDCQHPSEPQAQRESVPQIDYLANAMKIPMLRQVQSAE